MNLVGAASLFTTASLSWRKTSPRSGNFHPGDRRQRHIRLTALIQIRRIELLARLYEDVIIPGAVEFELRRTHEVLPHFIRVVPVADSSLPGRFVGELDAGESEAIALMLEGRGDLLLMDERKGRRVAKREGLRVIGLLGVLVTARKAGLLDSLRTVVIELERTAGFRIKKELKERLLREDGHES